MRIIILRRQSKMANKILSSIIKDEHPENKQEAIDLLEVISEEIKSLQYETVRITAEVGIDITSITN